MSRSIVWLLLAACLLTALLGGRTPAAAKGAAGDAHSALLQQTAPTPVPPRVTGKRSGARTSASRLPSKANAAVGGGGFLMEDVICERSHVAPPGTEVFGFLPRDRMVDLGKPHVFGDLFVYACHVLWGGEYGRSDSPYTYYLLDSEGNLVAEQAGDYFSYDFPPDAITGDYTITIAGSQLDPVTLQVSTYWGPRLELRDPTTHRDLSDEAYHSIPLATAPVVEAHFYGFGSEIEFEIALYQKLEDSSGYPAEYNLIDSWTATTDAGGEYRELLRFAPATEPGSYILVGCDVADCRLTFDVISELTNWSNGILVPPLAWEGFALGSEPEVRAFNFMRCAEPCTSNSRPVAEAVPERSTTLYLQWEYENIPAGADYVRTWRQKDRGEWIRYKCTWQGPTNGVQRVRLREPQGLHSGLWEVTVTVDGQEILDEIVWVDGDWSYWDPAGLVEGEGCE